MRRSLAGGAQLLQEVQSGRCVSKEINEATSFNILIQLTNSIMKMMMTFDTGALVLLVFGLLFALLALFFLLGFGMLVV